MKLGVRFEQRISFWLRAIPFFRHYWFVVPIHTNNQGSSGSECLWMQRPYLQVFTEGQIEMAETQVVDNQYKLLFTLFTIGNSGVSGAQLVHWVRG